jgi:hypothetical protein
VPVKRAKLRRKAREISGDAKNHELPALKVSSDISFGKGTQPWYETSGSTAPKAIPTALPDV